MINQKHSRQAVEPPIKGFVYYVRLKTDLGLLYKIGYTTMPSVEARFAFQGKGHEKLIDKVICFAPFDDAKRVEQDLHRYYRRGSGCFNDEPDMPMFGNGQSEIYDHDVLKLDGRSTDEKMWMVRGEISRRRFRIMGIAEDEITRRQNEARKKRIESDELIEPFLPFLRWAFRVYDWLMTPLHSGETLRVKGYLKILQVHVYDRDIERRKDLIRQKRELAKLEAELEHFSSLKEVERKVIFAIAAFKNKDLELFEQYVDIDLCAYRLVEAATDDFFMPSDYLAVANNCNLMELYDYMEVNGCRDSLLKPVENSYVQLLRHLVKTGTLLTEYLILPAGALFENDKKNSDTNEEARSPLNVYFGLKDILDSWGREWVLVDHPVIIHGEDWIEFAIAIKNSSTSFSGDLIIKARSTAVGKLDLDFPNFLDIDQAAHEAEQGEVGAQFPHRNVHGFRRSKLTD